MLSTCSFVTRHVFVNFGFFCSRMCWPLTSLAFEYFVLDEHFKTAKIQ